MPAKASAGVAGSTSLASSTHWRADAPEHVGGAGIELGRIVARRAHQQRVAVVGEREAEEIVALSVGRDELRGLRPGAAGARVDRHRALVELDPDDVEVRAHGEHLVAQRHRDPGAILGFRAGRHQSCLALPATRGLHEYRGAAGVVEVDIRVVEVRAHRDAAGVQRERESEHLVLGAVAILQRRLLHPGGGSVVDAHRALRAIGCDIVQRRAQQGARAVERDGVTQRFGVAAVVERKARHQHRASPGVVVDMGRALAVERQRSAHQQAGCLGREARAESRHGRRIRRGEQVWRGQRVATAWIDPDPGARDLARGRGAAIHQAVIGRGHREPGRIQEQGFAEVDRDRQWRLQHRAGRPAARAAHIDLHSPLFELAGSHDIRRANRRESALQGHGAAETRARPQTRHGQYLRGLPGAAGALVGVDLAGVLHAAGIAPGCAHQHARAVDGHRDAEAVAG